MKKYIAIALVLILVLSGCKSRKKEKEESSKSEEESSTQAQTETESETEAEEEALTKKLVVPEGYTLARIGMRLEEMDVCTTADFILAAQMTDFSDFPLIAAQEENPNRCYKLEGYLFPDTYEIYAKEKPASIIRRMLENTERKFTEEMRQQISETGYTVDQILSLASIIEKEAYERNDVPVPEEMPMVSSVLHNRLEGGNKLECNVTATYVTGAIDAFIDGGKDRYNDYYNTYYAPGLPAGPICNPGIDAINAAIFPAESSYMFFLTDEDKNFYYSETYEEHLVLVEKYLGKEG